MINVFAFLRLSERESSYYCQRSFIPVYDDYSTCSAAQQTGPVFHLGPQISTSCFLTSSSGSCASPLSGHGDSGPNHPDLPQLPRIEHLPASWIGVNGPPEAKVVVSSQAKATGCQRRAMAARLMCARGVNVLNMSYNGTKTTLMKVSEIKKGSALISESLVNLVRAQRRLGDIVGELLRPAA